MDELCAADAAPPSGRSKPLLTLAEREFRRQARKDFRGLRLDQQWAVETAYKFWDSSAWISAAAWGEASDEGTCFSSLSENDQARLRYLLWVSAFDAAVVQAWHSASAEALMALPLGLGGREKAEQMLMDSVNIVDLGFALKAVAASAAEVIAAGGRGAARHLVGALSERCCPDPDRVAAVVGSVPYFEFRGRLYVL